MGFAEALGVEGIGGLVDWNQHLYWLAPVTGLGAILIGMLAIFAPSRACEGFGLKTEGSGLSFVRATGARDIFIGLTFLALSWREDRVALALVCFGTAFVSGTDFVLTFTRGSRKLSLVHVSGVLVFASYGLWLFRQS